MRPIDADALASKLDDWRGDIEDVDKNDVHDVAYYSAMSRAIRLTEAMPTLDLAPVVHGEWVKDGGCECRCKKCGYAPLYDYFGRVRLSNFCPNCGANMNGGKKDD